LPSSRALLLDAPFGLCAHVCRVAAPWRFAECVATAISATVSSSLWPSRNRFANIPAAAMDQACRSVFRFSRSGPSARRPADLKIAVTGVALGTSTCLGAPVDFFGSTRPHGPPPNRRLEAMDSKRTLPENQNRSAQEILRPYFCLIGHSKTPPCRGSRVGQHSAKGANRCCRPAPPRPSGSGTCPRCARHTNEQPAVVAEVGRPPILRVVIRH